MMFKKGDKVRIKTVGELKREGIYIRVDRGNVEVYRTYKAAQNADGIIKGYITESMLEFCGQWVTIVKNIERSDKIFRIEEDHGEWSWYETVLTKEPLLDEITPKFLEFDEELI